MGKTENTIMTDRIPEKPPVILPLPEGIERPLWSVMIPVYNCSDYLRETLNAVLVQDLGEALMQIEVVDDGSTDTDVEALVSEIGKGRVGYYRQPQNVGSLRNFETCLNRARGQYIHLLHGDDKVRLGYYAAIQRLFEKFPVAGAAFCGWDAIDEQGELVYHTTIHALEDGIIEDFLERITVRQMLQYVAMTVRRSVYEKLGSFCGVNYGEDWEMWARIGAIYPVAYTPLILADYRLHDNNISSAKFYSGQHLEDINKVFTKIVRYLPPSKRVAAGRKLRNNYTSWVLDTTYESWYNEGNRELVQNQMQAIVRLYGNWSVFKKLLPFRLMIRRMAGHSFFPYKVYHSDLSKELFFPAGQSLEQEGFLVVYWWKTWPLGHVYWKKGILIPLEESKEFLVESIYPALEQYAKKAGMEEVKTDELLQYDEEALRERLQTIFENIQPEQKVPTVPVSVVICTRYRDTQLKHCLESLQQQWCTPEEIIVVDNTEVRPMETTRELVEKFPGVIYIKETRKGLDIARNAGGHMATCAIVAYVDDDVVVDPNWSYRVWKRFQDEQVGAMTGLVLAAELRTASQVQFERYWSFNKGYVEKSFDVEFIRTDRFHAPKVWNIGAGANMAFRKSVLAELNYFDERLDAGQAGCSGDSEIWFRVLAAGYLIIYDPGAVVHHYHRKEMKALQLQLFNYMRGHVAAALIQQDHLPGMQYRRQVFRRMPRDYINYLRAGYPNYTGRYITLYREIRGYLSGIKFYFRNRQRPELKYRDGKK